MDMRESFSRFKKKLKHPLTKSKRKPDRAGTEAGGERIDATGSLPRPEPHADASGSHEGGDNGGQPFSTNQPPRPDEPEPVPGRETGQEGREANVDGREGNQSYSVGSGPGREGSGADRERVEQVHPSSFTPSLVRGGISKGM
jgi:hypothetical protein